MKVLVTGGAGFIGRWTLRALPKDASVVIVDSLVPEVHGADPRFPTDVAERATCIQADVRDVDRWRDAAEGAEVVLHLASLTGTGQSMYQQARYVEGNVVATAALCDALAAMSPRPRRIVLASSRAVYGEGAYVDGDGRRVYPPERSAASLAAGIWDPVGESGRALRPVATSENALLQPASIYGLTKMWQEQLVSRCGASTGIETVALRFQNVYGPLQTISNPYTGILGILANGVAYDGRVELFEDGLMTRDFVHVRDVANAIAAAAGADAAPGRALNVGSGGAVTLAELAALLAEFSGSKPTIMRSGRFRVGDIRHALADMTAYTQAFGAWQPTPIREGLGEYLAWFREQPHRSPERFAAALEEMAERQLVRTAASGGRN